MSYFARSASEKECGDALSSPTDGVRSPSSARISLWLIVHGRLQCHPRLHGSRRPANGSGGSGTSGETARM